MRGVREGEASDMSSLITKFFKRSTLMITSLVLAVSSLSAAVPLFLSQNAHATSPANTITDNTTHTTYSTIQAAVSAANSGDTIEVGAGTYQEAVTINTPLSLVGDAGAVLEVNTTTQNGITIFANNVSVSGITITGPAVGVSYKTFPWGGDVTRGIFVRSGATGFSITNNNIGSLRNDILIDGNNTGSVTNNTIDNSKSGISVQYTDGSGITITDNHEGTFGNDWGLNLHLNGHVVGSTYFSNSQKIAVDAPSAAQQVVKDNSASNGGWTVQDQGYSTSNRTAVQVSTNGISTGQGDPLGTIDTIANGINAVVDGGKVIVASGTYDITTAIAVNKQVDIEGQSGATITTSGSAQIFTFYNSGSTLNGFTINKTDNADQNIIGIQASNTNITNNEITGQFTIAAGAGTTRAIVVSTTTGLNIANNTFNNLRQPAYINNGVVGTITNNYVNQTKGWVIVSDTNLTFSGNTWGTNAGNTDIAIINQDNSVNNYTCSVMLAIKANNNNASIDNQVLTTPCPVGAPTAPEWLSHDGTVLGAYTNVNQVTPSWTAPSTGTDHYNYSYTSPTNSTWSAPVAFSGTNIPDQAFGGAGNNGTEGAWQFGVQSVSASGDVSAWVESAPLTYDKTAPTGLENLSPADGTHSTTAGLTQITWKAASDLNGPVNYYYESSLSSATNSDRSFVSPVYQSGALTSTSIPTPNTPEGVYYWHVRAVDAANNYTAWTGAWMVTIDNTKPAVPTFVMKDANGNIVTNGYINTQNFTFALSNPSADGVVRYQLQYLDESNGLTWNPTDLSAAGHMTTLGLYTDNFTQGEGVHSFAFSACDATGNCSAFTALFTVTYDKTAPNITVNPISTTTNPPAVTGTVDDATAVVTVTLNGNPLVVTQTGLTWSADVPTALADGTYSVVATATDSANNYTTQTVPMTVATITTPSGQTTPAVSTTTTTTGTPTTTTGTNQGTAPLGTPGVLGTSTANNTPTTTGATDVKGASTHKSADTQSGWTLAWYWWVLIIVAVASFIWWLIAKRRRNQNA